MMHDVEQADRGRPIPLIGVLLGAAMLAIAAVVLPRAAPQLALPMLAGGGAAAGLALWLVALLTGLRRGPGWWVAGSLALLVLGGALAGYGASRIAHARFAQDASVFAEVETNPDGSPILPSNPVRGPLSALFAETVRADEREMKDYGALAGKLNLATLNSPYLLAQAPALLSRCGEIGALGTAAAQLQARRSARQAALLRAVEDAALSDTIKRGVAMIVAPASGSEDPLIGQESEMIAATQAACQLLARRTWSNANGYFGFASGADQAAFAALNARRVAVATARGKLQRAAKARFEEGRELVRAALS